MNFKITILIENKLGSELPLDTEHGLSLYIEAGQTNILFDTGESGDFIDNAKKLGVDLNKIDYCLLSHAHYDHTGGLKRLIKEFDSKFKLLIGRSFFKEKYKLRDGEYKYIGSSFDKRYLEENKIDVEFIKEDISYLTEKILVFTNFKINEEYSSLDERMLVKENSIYKKDEFSDEIVLGINTEKGLFLIVGCSHVGIVNIIETISERTGMNIYGIMGGTHLVNSDSAQIKKVISYFKEKNIKLAGVSHCTGEKAEKMFREELEEAFFNNNTGNILTVLYKN